MSGKPVIKENVIRRFTAYINTRRKRRQVSAFGDNIIAVENPEVHFQVRLQRITHQLFWRYTLGP